MDSVSVSEKNQSATDIKPPRTKQQYKGGGLTVTDDQLPTYRPPLHKDARFRVFSVQCYCCADDSRQQTCQDVRQGVQRR